MQIAVDLPYMDDATDVSRDREDVRVSGTPSPQGLLLAEGRRGAFTFLYGRGAVTALCQVSSRIRLRPYVGASQPCIRVRTDMVRDDAVRREFGTSF